MVSLKWRALRADGAGIRAVSYGLALRLSSALAVVVALSAALTFFLSDVLTGPAVTTGNARGTALVMMVAGVPLLVLSMLGATRGSWRFHVVWLGIVSYLTYNSFPAALRHTFELAISPLRGDLLSGTLQLGDTGLCNGAACDLRPTRRCPTPGPGDLFMDDCGPQRPGLAAGDLPYDRCCRAECRP